MDCEANAINLDRLIDLQIDSPRRRRHHHRHEHHEAEPIAARFPLLFDVIAKGAVLGGAIMLHLFFFLAVALMI